MRFSSKRVLAVVSVLLIALAAAACPKRVSIGEIESNPGRYADKEVAIAGNVTTSYGGSIPFMKKAAGLYKVDDGTGSIWVITKESVPGKNVQLGIKGKIQSGVTIDGKNYGLVLIEEDRKFKKN